MSEIDKAYFRQLLIKERAQILSQINKGDNLPLHMNPDRDDLAQDFITMEKEGALKALERDQLEKIEQAIQRLDEDKFGVCTNCGESIPIERLEIIPYAEHCVRCQSQEENRW